MQHSVQTSIERRNTRNAYIITSALMIATLPASALFSYFGYTANQPQLFVPALTLLGTLIFDILPLTLIRRGRKNLAMMLVIAAFVVNVTIVSFVLQGLGALIALMIWLVILSIVSLTMSPLYTTSGMIVAFLSGALVFALDSLLGADRARVPELERYIPYVAASIAIPIVYVFIREFNRFTLQAKITLGILLTGGFTVLTLVLFGQNRVLFISTFLTDRYEASVEENTENEILIITNAKADEIDALLVEIQSDLIGIAKYRAEFEAQKALAASGAYWNAAAEIVQLPGGQYGNSGTDRPSIYIPNLYTPSEAMFADLNTSIYLDFLVPGFLESHPEAAAVYYVSKLGYTVYYPNIRLAENVPPDFDPTLQPFYTIATPENNADRLPRWTQPYQDPAGAGLVVTVSTPVYDGGSFEGVISADIQLAQVVQFVSEIQLGESGIPLLTDDKGLIIAMTESGYDYFQLEPEVVAFNQTPKQTIFDTPSAELREIALQVFGSQSGLSRFTVEGIETYLSVAILDTTGYKLAFIAPVSELNRDVISLREEVETEVTSALRNVTIILALLFGGAFIASLAVGQIITRPLKRLTQTVEQIATGNLASRASVETEDESGLLARSFNAMADRLTETMQGLEDRISERTGELEALSQSNTYRATLFEAIARISRSISSTRSIDRLLPQITETISSQLGYYHVGIFMVDVHGEYAVLRAANSEGGKNMLARNHRLRIGETGIVGYVTHSGEPRVALDVGQDAVFFNNPDLPETHSEIALPLRSGSTIIGALDVQSKNTNAFSNEDVNILSTLADQVSIAIQNATSFQQTQEALEQAQRAAAQLSEQQWSRYLTGDSAAGYHFDGVTAQAAEPDFQTPPNNIAIPIILRGVQIGTLKLSAPDPDRIWEPNELAMAQATAERTALAIETARLLQDAQKRAAKERTIGQISAKIGSLVNIDNIVQTTIQELGATLPGADVAIQFISGQSGQKD